MIFKGLLLVFIFEYMRPGTYFGPLSALYSILPLTVFALSVTVSGRFSNGEIFQNRTTLWVIYFLMLIGLSIVMTAVVRHVAYTVFTQVLGYAFLYFMLVKLTTDFSRIKTVFATISLIHVGLILLNPAIVLNADTRNSIQGVTFLGDGNDFSLSVVITLPMCLFLVQETKSTFAKMFLLLVAGILIFAVIGTSSRGGALALAAVLLYMWSQSRRKVLTMAVLALVTSGVLALAPPVFFERMQTLENPSEEGSAKGRLDAWSAATRMAADQPLSGVGAGHFGMMYSLRYRPPDWPDEQMPWLTAHSVYFLTFGELGWPGVLFLFAMIPGSLLLNFRRMREVGSLPADVQITYRRLIVAVNSSIIGFGVAGAFLSAIYYPHIYVLAGLVAIVDLLYRDLKRQASPPQSPDSSQG